MTLWVTQLKKKYNLTVLPIYLFETILVLGPLAYIVFLSFMTRGEFWDVKYVFTLENYIDIFNPLYLPALLQSLKVGAVTTFVCILLGYPAGIIMGTLENKWSDFFRNAILIPFLFNSMMQICGLIIILRNNGILDKLFMTIGLTEESLHILYSFPAVIIGMVYVLLPFMIYSVYSSAAKMDTASLEAARIMGASSLRAFFDVTLPLTAGGLLNGTVLCFIPAMGLYIISSLLGGGRVMLISNVIEDQLMKVHNLPFSSALAVVLMLLTTIGVSLAWILDPVSRKTKKARKLNESGKFLADDDFLKPCGNFPFGGGKS